MLYIERVVGNVKGGADVTIGRCTLISGVNGSGKSTIVNIIELALMGYASDIVGRPEVRKGVDLITLAPEDEALKAEVYTTENDRAHFTIERNGPGKTKEASHVGLADTVVVWPIREAVTALRGATATARSFVLRHGGLNVAEDSILARFGDDQTRTLYQTLAAGVRAQAKTDDPVDVLLGVQDAAKKSETAIKAKAKGAKEVIEQTSSALTVEPSEEEGQAAQKKIDQLTERLAELRVAAKPPPPAPPVRDVKAEWAAQVNVVGQRVAQKQGLLTELAGQYQQLSGQLSDPASVPPPRPITAEQAEGVVATNGAYAYHKKHLGSLGHCIVCWQLWNPTEDLLNERHQQISGLFSAYQEQEKGVIVFFTEQKKKQAQLEQIATKAQSVHQELVAEQNAYAEAVRQYELAPALVSGGAGAEPFDPTAFDSQIQAVLGELNEARKALLEIQKLRAGWDLVRKAQKQIIEAKREAEGAKSLAEEAGSVADALLTQGRAGFVQRVQAFLPPDDEFDVVLKDGKRSVCMFGFRRNGVLHTALSGAEWARLTIALGAAIIPTEGRVLAILTPEERAFDPDTLGEVMAALKAAPGQVILTSPVEPPSPIEGWTMLRRG